MKNNLIGLEPRQFDAYVDAIQTSGGEIAEMSPAVEALVWTDYARPDLLAETLEANPQLIHVQLPFAGVDAFSQIIKQNPKISIHLSQAVIFRTGCRTRPDALHGSRQGNPGTG